MRSRCASASSCICPAAYLICSATARAPAACLRTASALLRIGWLSTRTRALSDRAWISALGELAGDADLLHDPEPRVALRDGFSLANYVSVVRLDEEACPARPDRLILPMRHLDRGEALVVRALADPLTDRKERVNAFVDLLDPFVDHPVKALVACRARSTRSGVVAHASSPPSTVAAGEGTSSTLCRSGEQVRGVGRKKGRASACDHRSTDHKGTVSR